MKKITTIYCTLAIFIPVFLSSAGCTQEAVQPDPVRPVRVYRINGNTGPEQRTFPGKVKATKEVSLAFRVPGQIIDIAVSEGDKVQEGQLIAQLDPNDFQSIAGNLEARLTGALSVQNEARLNFERNSKLIETGIISQSAFDSAQSSYVTSQANVRSIQQNLHLAKLNLQYTRLEAPFEGTIAITYADNHEYIQAKEAIVQLEDTSSLDIVVNMPESVWARTFSGHSFDLTEVRANFETLPNQSFPLQLKEYRTKADPQTQTYAVTLTMKNPEGMGIRPGMTATVRGNMPNNKDVEVSIPVSSVTGKPGQIQHVWVLTDDKVHRREIKTGRFRNNQFLVKTGLVSGEVVVVSGVNYLEEGQRVTILKGKIGERQ